MSDVITRHLDLAAETCAQHGAKLTGLRRSVLSLVMQAGRPVGAYALLDQLKAERANAAPVTVYRALDFLLEHGLVHRIERLNAFIACTGPGEHDHHGHAVQFLICRRCGTVAEMEDRGIADAVTRAAGQTGFCPDHATVEVEGLCGHCAAPS